MSASTPEQTCKRCAHPESAHVLEGRRCDTEVSDYGALDCQCSGFQPVRVEEPPGEPVGDETEALLADREREWLASMPSWSRVTADSPPINGERLLVKYDKALARVAGLEAREAALRDALELIAHGGYGDASVKAKHGLRMAADSGEAGS